MAPKGPFKPIDWRRVFVRLEAGYMVRDIAVFFDVHPNTMPVRARKELRPERFARYRELAYKNRPDYRPPAECGTPRGYNHHRYVGTPACFDCLDAHAEHMREYRSKRDGKIRKAAPRPRPRGSA